MDEFWKGVLTGIGGLLAVIFCGCSMAFVLIWRISDRRATKMKSSKKPGSFHAGHA
jgi:preprotein translocase subunit SecG